ncbi:MAG: sporulation protein [Oscillibacter ruminantium]|uniref:nucleoside recognition domain-containing protein n=1 Tax=Oscillibacter ruminantium TaxID=1263547 RepID=UPI002B2013F7|nr:nucleoside recognition domain-containing protein [Oscillibacter ruminantium]MEA5041902.1 sporulation protein [Oscillibacter ruminantium]
MKRKTVLCLLAALGLAALLANAEGVRQSVSEALTLCGETVIPSQFLFLTASSLLVSLGVGEVLAPRLEFLMWPLFRVDGAGATALILGLVGGYPIGARTAAELYRENLVSEAEAERLLAFCNTANPAFLISVLGAGVFHSVRVGVWLWLIHVLSALLTGILFRGGVTVRAKPRQRFVSRAVPLTTAFVGAVRGALSSMLNICAFVTVFYVLAQPLRNLTGFVGAAAVGFLELFSVIPLVPNSSAGFVLASVLAGWGGVSVLFQTLAVLADSGLSTRNCLLGKAVQSGLSGGLALLVVGYVMG